MPNWHLHYQVANYTFDPEAKPVRGGKQAQTGAFRALNLLPIKVHAAELQAAFHDMLKQELQGMGLPLRSTTHRYPALFEEPLVVVALFESLRWVTPQPCRRHGET